ncbi:MAG: hypothetical protein GWO23_02740, partial [Gammaproteobacteria bacterium]|nr:hypothetical protein [Gammaproteobacteria bacterium]
MLSYNLAQLGASGNVWFVSLAGNDANSGESWDDAFRTIIYAVSVALPGDKIIVGTGTYDETANGAAGIVIAQPFIWIEGVGNVFVQNTNTDNNGVVIHFAPTTIGSVMQNFAVRKGEAVSANSVCVLMDAFFCGVNDTSILLEAGATTHAGIKLTSNASLCQITGKPDVLRAIVGLGGVGTGILFDGAINNAVDSMILAQLTTGLLFTGASLINGTTQNINITGCNIGIQLDAGVLGNVIGARFTNCVVDVLDNSGNGTNERTSVSLVTPGAHEDMYPVHLGQGVAASPVTITNTATDDTPDSRDDQDYWGDTIAVIAPGVITGRWISNGIELFAGVANKIMRMEFYYPQPGFSTTRNGGNLWDLGETVLTV